MPNTPNSIRLEVPKGRIGADLLGLARHLVQAAAQGAVLQNWANVIANLFAAARTVRVERSEGALAWQLLLTGIGEALTEVANLQPPTLINERDIDTISKRVEAEAADLIIQVDFLEHPWSLPPVVLAKETLLTWLAPPTDSSIPQDLVNLRHRFDAALVLGLHRTVRRNEARYRPLLDLRKDPTGPAWQVLEDWRLYHARLVCEFRTAPVFDESFSIDQLYVPLNAWHDVEQESDGKAGPKKSRGVVRLDDDTMAWLRGERGAGRLRLVTGGPGSGKSTAMKALAAALVEEGNNGHQADALLFPLQRFQWRSGIVESVAATSGTYTDQMRHNPLDPAHLRERQNPLLLIFDGLDELTASAQVSEAISSTFLRELNTALRNWEDRPVWAIVTGRDAIFGNVEGPVATLPGERFHLLPYHVRENEPDAPSRSDYHDPDGLLSTDNREKAFRLFAKAKGKPSDDLPMMYRNNDLHDVSAQPLLNYFMLTSGPAEVADGNCARIYGGLFERLHSRNRNDNGRPQDAGKPAAGLSQDQFDRAFEAMAVAAWRTGGTRAASWDGVLKEVRREDSYLKDGKDKLEYIFERIDPGAQWPFRLAAAFFFRNDHATGVEFTHKSFADYLYARRLSKAVAAMADVLHQTPEAEEGMLCRWEALTSTQRMSYEVAHFLQLEIQATVDSTTLSRRHTALKPVVERLLQEGRQVHGETCQRRAEQLSSQMEEALFIAWHAMWRPDGDRRYWQLGEDTGELLFRALARQEGVHGRQFAPAFVAHWSGADLNGAELSRSRLNQAVLTEANLEDADIRGTDLGGACLSSAVLTGANLTGVVLTGANLRSTNFSDADLTGAEITGADLRQAVLTGANLRGADLLGSILDGANLSNADLTDANLTIAQFTGANLRCANLTGALHFSANFRDADVTGVVFNKNEYLSNDPCDLET